jgi:hypothetical protein
MKKLKLRLCLLAIAVLVVASALQARKQVSHGKTMGESDAVAASLYAFNGDGGISILDCQDISM